MSGVGARRQDDAQRGPQTRLAQATAAQTTPGETSTSRRLSRHILGEISQCDESVSHFAWALNGSIDVTDFEMML